MGGVMESEFTEHTLPTALKALFEANGYSVQGPVHKAGAEVDLVATQLSGFVETQVFIEATVQYVDNTKYGKDLSKLVMFQHLPGAQRMIVSSKGFTPNVRERAAEAGVLTFTYDELYRKFERTEPYIKNVLGDSVLAKGLRELDQVYEEPFFEDRYGHHKATEYLGSWLTDDAPDSQWLILVGEYGTGKTALTRVLQRRWTEQYRRGEIARLPFRIELRNFAKQFDARGLLHHFLDGNELQHLPVTFVESMISKGRVVLLLDGYDEMAQYLNVRERRACLEALAGLAQAGARGILTSRPNYFTQAEELRVFEVLYRRLKTTRVVEQADRDVVEKERQIDGLLERFVTKRVERQLRDLTQGQTLDLVQRRLADDPAGAAAVSNLLSRVFRTESGRNISLSGKPVIVTYLLEVVDELKSEDDLVGGSNSLTEWDVYDLVVNKLMLRDHNRTSELLPSDRKTFLQHLALKASTIQSRRLTEPMFRELVREQFSSRLARMRANGATDAEDSLFDDLRSSSTLTRAEGDESVSWQFSHNSLREFLLVGYLLDKLKNREPESAVVAVSDSMHMFARTVPEALYVEAEAQFCSLWPGRASVRGMNRMFELLWSAKTHRSDEAESLGALLKSMVGSGLDISQASLARVDFSQQSRKADLAKLNAYGCDLVEVDFRDADLTDANFSDSGLDGCVFAGATIAGANFRNVLMLDCDMTGIRCAGADFTGIDSDSNALVRTGSGVEIYSGDRLRGFLLRNGALTDEVDPYFLFEGLAGFTVCEKVCRVLSDGATHQRRGVEQRGAAERNIPLARKFVDYLIAVDYVHVKGTARRMMITATPVGRPALARLVEDRVLDPKLEKFFRANLLRGQARA
ncbi:hypothetical protein GCM10023148_24460 [Actinokineospora soli]